VTSLALITAASTVRSAVLLDVPTIRFPTETVDPLVGKLTAAVKDVAVGRKDTVPAV
jgi:hypothetical protein